MFRVLLREIEDLCSFPTLDVSGTSKLQAEGNCLEDQRLLLLPWVESGLCPVLQQRVQLKTSSAKHCLCITFSYGFTWLESKESVSDIGAYIFAEWGVVPEYVVGILPLWYRNFWRSTLFQRDQSWNFTLWHLLQSNSEKQFLFTKELRCALSEWRS